MAKKNQNKDGCSQQKVEILLLLQILAPIENYQH